MNHSLSDAAMNCNGRVDWVIGWLFGNQCGRLAAITYPYKKVDHKKYVERQINLLCDVVAPLLTTLHVLCGGIDEVDDKRRYTEYEHEDHLKMDRNH